MHPNEPRPSGADPSGRSNPLSPSPGVPAQFGPLQPVTPFSPLPMSAPFTPPPSASGVVFEMHPDSKTFWRGVGTRALILLPLIALGVSNSVRRDGVGWTAILYVGLVVVLLAAVMIMLQTSRVVLTLTSIEKHRLLLPPKRIHRAGITGSVLVPQYVSSMSRVTPLMLLVGSNGRSLLKLTGQIFEAGALFTLAERMGMDRFDVLSGPTGPKDVARRYPKAVSVFERRPVLVVLLGTLILVVLIVAGVTIFDPVQD